MLHYMFIFLRTNIISYNRKFLTLNLISIKAIFQIEIFSRSFAIFEVLSTTNNIISKINIVHNHISYN